ncbi:hypothetical protein QYM36_016975 [Artemia franciscana]|uniref:Centrosomin N-terminal motif 1 domain-containing protein n=1 Tax=Artemia franciscana TaxID=6661 RepID=A0AA88HG16_ARTSF|nr:hypothetical protein QYM36_016975 [Artemia franciscana]
MAGRSPGKSSPGRSNTSTGRCVRELEEQLEELRKENFNLKLKIYFLEERFGRLYGVGEKSDLAKNNIELQCPIGHGNSSLRIFGLKRSYKQYEKTALGMKNYCMSHCFDFRCNETTFPDERFSVNPNSLVTPLKSKKPLGDP